MLREQNRPRCGNLPSLGVGRVWRTRRQGRQASTTETSSCFLGPSAPVSLRPSLWGAAPSGFPAPPSLPCSSLPDHCRRRRRRRRRRSRRRGCRHPLGVLLAVVAHAAGPLEPAATPRHPTHKRRLGGVQPRVRLGVGAEPGHRRAAGVGAAEEAAARAGAGGRHPCGEGEG